MSVATLTSKPFLIGVVAGLVAYHVYQMKKS